MTELVSDIVRVGGFIAGLGKSEIERKNDSIREAR